MLYWPGYFLWQILSLLFFPKTIIGSENLPRSGGFILASNHISNLDPFVIGTALTRPISFVAKDSLFKNKVIGWILWQVNAFPIKRASADIGAVKETLRRLKNGTPVVLFPEGTRIVERKKVNPGIALLAVKSGVPVVPVFIKDSDRVMPPGKRFFRRHSVSVRFGRPRVYSQGEFTSFEAVAACIMEEINSLA